MSDAASTALLGVRTVWPDLGRLGQGLFLLHGEILREVSEMKCHVHWDVRNGADGHHHVTRTEVVRSVKADGTKVSTVKTDHLKTPRGR